MENQIETVIKSFKAGIDVQTISNISGLSIEEVKKILEEKSLNSSI